VAAGAVTPVCYAGAMPRFEPFAGLRYDSGRVDLSKVVAPPYDVISPEERARLVARHSTNVVRVELPEPDRRRGLDRYRHAAAQLEQWQRDGTLRRDPQPALYVYRMTTPEGRTTNGVIGALGIDDRSAADILPHEETLPKATGDRLDLLSATRANLSPIWGLSLAAGLTAAFEQVGPPTATAEDGARVIHDLWVVVDPTVIAAVGQALASAPVVMADGHHRYETARTYHRGRSGSGADGSDLVMALIVELAPGQLQVGPIHRVLSGLPDGLDLVDAFSSWFDVTRAGDFDERTVGALAQSECLALIMASGAWLLSPKDGTPEAAGASLDSSMVALVIAELPDHELEFTDRWSDAVGAVGSEAAQAAVLLRAVTVDQIAEWARAGRRMPPKTTYFHPKARTGMVIRTLDPDPTAPE
jgi:uncharacterized protein (DUF1015 family)